MFLKIRPSNVDRIAEERRCIIVQEFENRKEKKKKNKKSKRQFRNFNRSIQIFEEEGWIYVKE